MTWNCVMMWTHLFVWLFFLILSVYLSSTACLTTKVSCAHIKNAFGRLINIYFTWRNISHVNMVSHCLVWGILFPLSQQSQKISKTPANYIHVFLMPFNPLINVLKNYDFLTSLRVPCKKGCPSLSFCSDILHLFEYRGALDGQQLVVHKWGSMWRGNYWQRVAMGHQRLN